MRTFIGFTGLALIAAGLVGYGLNIIKLVHMAVILSGLGIGRIVGIFIPFIGAVLGYVS